MLVEVPALSVKGQHHGQLQRNRAVDLAFQRVQVVLDVFRRSEFAGPASGRQLPGRVRRHACGVGEMAIFS